MRALVAVLVLLFAVVVTPAVEVSMLLPNPIVPNVTVNGRIVVTDPPGSITDFEFDSQFSGLSLRAAGINQQSSNINGVKSFTYSIRVQVSATQTGVYDLEPTVIQFEDGSSVSTDPATLEVWEPQTWLEGQAVVRAEFIPDTIVPGQNSELRWQVCAPLDFDLEAEPDKRPRMPDELIARGDVEQLGNGVAQSVSGDLWQIMTYSLQVTCSTPGTHRADGQLRLGRLVQSFFDSSFRPMFTAPIRPATLTVAALPMVGRPDDFTGLVGEITISTELERDSVVLGEGTRLTVDIRGPQVDFTSRPQFQSTPGLRLRPLDDSSGSGWQRFTWNVEPERSGDFTVGALSVPWFDPASGSYQRSSSPGLQLTVLPGQQRQATVVGQVTPVASSAPTVIAPTMPAPLHGAAVTPPTVHLGWIALIAGVVAGLAIGLGLRFTTSARTVDPATELRRALKSDDLARIDRALHALHATCSDPQQQAQLKELVTKLERVRFGGGTLDESMRKQLQHWGQA